MLRKYKENITMTISIQSQEMFYRPVRVLTEENLKKHTSDTKLSPKRADSRDSAYGGSVNGELNRSTSSSSLCSSSGDSGRGLSPVPVVSSVALAALSERAPSTPLHDRQIQGLKPKQSYRSSRYAVVMQALKKSVLKLVGKCKISDIFDLDSSDPSQVRKSQYPKFLKLLREAVNRAFCKSTKSLNQETNQERKLVGELCYAHFAVETEHDPEIGKNFIVSCMGKDYSPESIADLDAKKMVAAFKKNMKTRSLWSRIKSVFNSVCRSKNANSVSWFSWDPAQYSVRSKLAEISLGGKKVTLLRTACPVMGHNNNLEIDPLFRGLIEHYKINEQQYLYVNNQSFDLSSDRRRNSKKPYSQAQAIAETNRSKALLKFSEQDGIKDTLKFLSLPHDSDFYKQKPSITQSSENFINEFLENLMQGKQGYHLPEKYLQEKEKVQIRQILEGVLKTYFENTTSLNQKKRKEFINLAHTLITADVMETLNIAAANITCKDGVDRAAGSAVNLIVYADIANYQGKLDPEKMNYLTWILGAPSLLNHGRPPKEGRHQRAIPALQRMVKFAPQQST